MPYRVAYTGGIPYSILVLVSEVVITLAWQLNHKQATPKSLVTRNSFAYKHYLSCVKVSWLSVVQCSQESIVPRRKWAS